MAHAQDAEGDSAATSDEEARAIFERGRVAYDRGLFTEAEDLFMAAYEAMPPEDSRRVLILANVAQAIDRQGGRDEDALEVWRRFEAEAATVADDSVLLRASERIRELEERLRRRQRDPADEPEGAETAPGLEPAPELEPEPQADGPSPHWASYVLMGAGSAAVVAGSIVGIVGLSRRSSVLEMCDGTVCQPEAREDAESLDGLALTADLLIWPGLAAAAAGAVLFFTTSDDGEEEGSITARCGLAGCVVGGSF